jgi:hypothetical protein
MKTSFNTLAEFEEILREGLNMISYHLVYEDDQPKFMEVETAAHKIRRVRAVSFDRTGHLRFQFTISENGNKGKLLLQVHRVVFLLENPLANISGLVVDHINHCPTDNRIQNLQAITNRENLTKDKTITPVPTNHTVEYCQAKLNEHENEYLTYLTTHPDISHDTSKNSEVKRLSKNVGYWKQKLAYATLNNQYEFKMKELF